jgi:hypothetical protein
MRGCGARGVPARLPCTLMQLASPLLPLPSHLQHFPGCLVSLLNTMLSSSTLRREKRPAAPDAEGDEMRRPRKRERYTRVAWCVLQLQLFHFPPPRARRGGLIAVFSESCKSRKVKCSGNQPCSRCSELDMRCTYNDYIPQPPSE